MNDDEGRDGDEIGSPIDVREIDADFDEMDVEPVRAAGVYDAEFGSVALSVARNNNDNDYASSEFSEDTTPSEKDRMDSLDDENYREEFQLISERVREGGLQVSDETIQIGKMLLPEGEQVS